MRIRVSDGAIAALYLLLSLPLFAYFEFLASLILKFVTLDIYLMLRMLAGVSFSIFLVILIQISIRNSNFSYKSTSISIFQYIQLLNRYDRVLLLAYGVSFSISTIGLSIGFSFAPVVLIAYVLFSFHPLWVILIRLIAREETGNKYFILTGIFILVFGVMVFGLRENSIKNILNFESIGSIFSTLSQNMNILTLIAYISTLIGGFAFAVNNYLSGKMGNNLKVSFHHLPKEIVSMFGQYNQTIRYIVGLLMIITLVPFVMSSFFNQEVFGFYSAIKEESISKFSYVLYEYGFNINYNYLKFVALFIAVICAIFLTFANFFLTLAMQKGNVAIISALESLAILISAVIVVAHGVQEKTTNETTMLFGIVLIVIGAGLLSLFSETNTKD